MTARGHIRKTVKLSIGSTAYECEVTGVTLTPSAEVKTTNALCDDGALADVGIPSWALDVDYLVDHKAGSFFRFAVEHTGEVATFTYEPDPTNAPGVTYGGSLRVVPGPAGGAFGDWEAGKVSLPVIGKPTITDPPANPAADAPEPVEVEPVTEPA